MPFTSKAQRAWMYANKPEMAKRWEKETPNYVLKRLPNTSKRNRVLEYPLLFFIPLFFCKVNNITHYAHP